MNNFNYELSNFNFHKLCYKNDYNNIKLLLDNNRNLLYKKGLYEYPIHIACFIGSDKLISLFLYYDKNILDQKNIRGQTGYHILSLYPKCFFKFFKVSKFKINSVDDYGYTVLTTHILNSVNIDIEFIKKLKSNGASIYAPNENSKIAEIILKKCNLLEQLHNIFNIDFNKYDKKGLTTMHNLIIAKDINCIKKILKFDVDINNSGIDGKSNIFEYALRYGNLDIIKFLLKHPINFEYTNQYSDTYLHGILLSKKNAYPTELIGLILNKTKDLNIQNIDGSSIIHLLTKTNSWKDYIKILKSKDINLSLTNKEGKTPLDYLTKEDRYIFLDKIMQSKEENVNCKVDNINFIKLRKANYTLFTAYTKDTYIYSIFVLEKYRNISMPFCDNNEKKKIPDNLKDKLSIKFWMGIKLLHENYNGLLCSDIYWHNRDLFYIHNNFYDSLKNLFNKDYIFFNISLVNIDINHANIIIIDNVMKTIERFDPLGVMDFNDVDYLDSYLNEKINKVISSVNRTKYKYIRPKDFLRINSFQSLSRHEDINNQNTGDIAGFCLAWCFWYLENRINNPNVKQKILVDKLEKKLINNKQKIIEYIRSYANKLNSEKIKILKEFKLTPNEYYKIFPGYKELINIYDLIFNKIKSIKK